MPKLVFFSTSNYSNPVLKALQDDSRYNIMIINKKLSTKQLVQKIQPFKPDVGVIAIYGIILKQAVIDLFPKGIVNIHPSLLPKHRGPTPVATSILCGDKTTGVTLFLIDEKVDHGPLLAQSKLLINPTDTRDTLTKKLFEAGAQLLIEILPNYLNNKLRPTTQDHNKATFTQKLTKEDCKINWKQSNEYIERLIRALTPWPGTWTEINGKRVLIHQARLQKGELIIKEIQVAGKGKTSGAWTKDKLFAYIR